MWEILECFAADKETRVRGRLRALVWTAAKKRGDEEDTLEGTKEGDRDRGRGTRRARGRVTPCFIRSGRYCVVLNDLKIGRRRRKTKLLSHVTRHDPNEGERENLPKNPAKTQRPIFLPPLSLSFLIIISPAETIYHLYQSPTSPPFG